MTKTTITKKAILWGSDLHELESDIFFLKNNRTDFITLSQMYSAGKLDPFIYNFITRNYASAMTGAIRKIADNDRRVISLFKIIEDIERNSSNVTKEWFITNWKGEENNPLFKVFLILVPLYENQ